MNEGVFIEVSDILDSFDLAEIQKLISEQINTNYTSDEYTPTIDFFKPLYYNYAKLSKYDIDEDTRKQAESKFYMICFSLLRAILSKFDIEIDHDWLSDHYSDIPGITIAFYSFFVLDFNTNLYELLVNYINTNSVEISKIFESLKIKKDASSMSNRKNLSNQMALIISNIYDISDWIFQALTEQDYFEYLNNSYVPVRFLSEMYKDDRISANFAAVIYNIFHSNITLKSEICFKYISQVKNGEIKDLFTKSDETNKE